MNKVVRDIAKYKSYMVYAAICELKNNVINSYLGWMWLILDPFLHMVVYSFIVRYVFNSNEPYLPVFVYIGRIIWNFFSSCVKQSIKVVKSNRDIILKIYIPKFMFVNIKMLENLFRLFIASILLIIMAIFFNVKLSVYLVFLIPLIILLWVGTFACCALLLHLGVFIDDLNNLIDVVLRLGFYVSGVFYSLRTRLPAPFGDYLVHYNPVAYIIDEVRNVILFGTSIDLKWYFIWLVISILFSILGVKLIYKYESIYAKVI